MSHSFILSAAIRGKDLYLPYELDEKEANISDLKRVSFWHGVSRFFKTGSAAKQDIRVANVFLRTISSMQNNSVQDPLIIEAAKTYCEAHKKFKDLPFKRLRNFLYAHHCSELIGINIEDLVDDNGDAKNELLEFLRKNNLHRIIPEVNEEIKNSSILFNEEGKIFIRSVDGDSFLESKEQVKVILQNIKENDSGYKELNDLLNAYQRLEELENKLKRQSQAGNSKFTLFTMYVLNSLVPANRANFDLILKELKDSNEYPHLIEKYELDKNEHDRDLLIMYYFIEKNCDTAKKLFYDEMQRLEHSEDIPCEYRDAFERYPSHLKKEIEEQKIKILAMKEKLSEYHFCYKSLETILQNSDKWVLVSRAYLPSGLKLHNNEDWKILNPSKIERIESKEKKFSIRIVTKLPPYSFQRGWTKFLLTFFPRLFGNHGHSWIELVEEDKGIRKIYSVGYLMIPNKRLMNPDPNIFVPPKREERPYIKKLKVVEEQAISEEQFLLSKQLIESIQAIVRNGGDDSVLQPSEQLNNDIIETAKNIFYRIFGSNTCLGFAREVYRKITKVNIDSRPWILRIIFHSSFANYWADIRRRLGKTFIIGKIISYITFLFNMQIPHFRFNVERRK